MTSIRHVVIPVAGLGTRLLPMSSVVPKELFPLGKWPALFYTIREALNAGIEEIVLVVSPEKRPWIQKAFSPHPKLKNALSLHKNQPLLEELLQLDIQSRRLRFVEQDIQSGLGHAILCARSAIGSEPFCVALPDEHLISASPELQMLTTLFDRTHTSCVTLYPVPWEQVHHYGIGAITHWTSPEEICSLSACIEKPSSHTAPSNYAFIGRYAFEPLMWELLASLAPGEHGEIQLTDAMHQLAVEGHLLGHVFQGLRYDIGTFEGYYACLAHHTAG